MNGNLGPLWLAILLPSCAVSEVEPTPFNGVAPRSLLVAPVDNLTGQVGVQDAFVPGAALQLEDRGYYVYPTDTGLSLLRGQDPTVENLVQTGVDLHLDGVLVITVVSWNAIFDRVLESLDYEVRYRIHSTQPAPDGSVSGEVIWEHAAAGHYQREREPLRLEGGREVGPAFPGFEGSFAEGASFIDNRSVASAVSRMIFQHLPVATDPADPPR